MKHPKVKVKNLGKTRAWGLYFEDLKEIHFDHRLKGKKKLDIYIHEYTHHHFPDMDEDAVTRFATHLADFLWRQHFRPVDNSKTQD